MQEEMTEHQEAWDKERAQRHARWAKLGSRLVYGPFAREIVAYLGSVEQGAAIVDLGTGPGFLSIELGRLVPQARIIGVDPSSEMLDIARENADRAGVSNYETRLGRAEQMSIASDSVTLVVTQSSLHEWEDPQKGLLEVLRVLKPGGSLVLKDYNRGWLSKWKRKLFELFHHLEMFKFTFEEVVELLGQCGFDQIEGRGRGLQYLVRAAKR